MGAGSRRWWWYLLSPAGLLLALYTRWLEDTETVIRQLLRPDQLEHGVVPAPGWLDQAVKNLPRRRVNASEREVFRRDGAILIKGLVPDKSILRLLDEKLGWEKNKAENQWWLNGILHSLIKHGPFAELSATALDVPAVTIWNAQVEPRPGKEARTWPLEPKPWLDKNWSDPRDQSVHEDTDAYFGDLHKAGHFVKPQASIYLAVTDIPHGLELLAGSHVANQLHRCRRENGLLDADCMDRLERDCGGVRWWDLEAGDAILFYGSTFHWSVLQEKPRLALSVRYVPADMMYNGFLIHPMLASWVNWACGPIGGCPAHPIFYSTDRSRMKDQPWPLYSKNKDRSPLVGYLRYFYDRYLKRCQKIYDW